jgi:hypothetical protein
LEGLDIVASSHAVLENNVEEPGIGGLRTNFPCARDLFGMQICFQAGRSEDPDNKARQRTTSTRRKQERGEAWRSVPCSALLGFLTVRVSSSVAIHNRPRDC